jgi:hypothetical protein
VLISVTVVESHSILRKSFKGTRIGTLPRPCKKKIETMRQPPLDHDPDPQVERENQLYQENGREWEAPRELKKDKAD